MKKIKMALMCTGIVLTLQSYGQKIPLGAMPMLYNGGFAGEGKVPRFNLTANYNQHYFAPYSNGTKTNEVTNYTAYASYDQFLPKIRTGIGITLKETYMDFNSPLNLRNGTNRSLLVSVSPKFSFKGKYTIAPFINFGYTNTDYTQNSSDSIPKPDAYHPNWAMNGTSGLLFNTQKFYLGVSFNLFYKGSRYEYETYYASRNLHFVLQTGYTFQRLPESEFSFTPQIAVKFYEAGTRLDINLMFRYKQLIWSFNNTGIGVGFQNKRFRAMFSQSVTSNHYKLNSTLSLRYTLN